MTRRKVEARARARRLDGGTRSSYFQLGGTTPVLVPPLFIMNGGILLLLLPLGLPFREFAKGFKRASAYALFRENLSPGGVRVVTPFPTRSVSVRDTGR